MFKFVEGHSAARLQLQAGVLDRKDINVFQLLKKQCMLKSNEEALYWLDKNGDRELTVTYGQFLQKIRTVARFLHTEKQLTPGSRVVLCYPPGLDFFCAFWACLSTGLIAVPVCPADPFNPKSDAGAKLSAIIADCEPVCILTDLPYLTALKTARLLEHEAVTSLPLSLWWPTDQLSSVDSRDWEFPTVDTKSKDLCFLQYTSGSTGNAKGVMVGHRNLIVNAALIMEVLMAMWDREATLGALRAGLVVSWLPHFHDMGLIGFHVAPLLGYARVAYMSPVNFLRNPMSWLRALSDPAENIISGAPCFALDLCVNKVDDSKLSSLDLSRVAALLLGASPVEKGPMDRFVGKFGPCGFQSKAYLPCYGLAENVLLCSAHGDRFNAPRAICVSQPLLQEGKLIETDAREAHSRWLVASGDIRGSESVTVPNPGAVAIVDPTTNEELPDGAIGEIWVCGQSKTQGYWKKDSLTEQMFEAQLSRSRSALVRKYDQLFGTWLRTGDFGCFVEGYLYITGRMKDLIIINGVNLYPHDIEEAIRYCNDSIRPGNVCAVPTTDKIDGYTERLTLLVEVRDKEPSAAADYDGTMISIGMAIASLWAKAPSSTVLRTLMGPVRKTGSTLFSGALTVSKSFSDCRSRCKSRRQTVNPDLIYAKEELTTIVKDVRSTVLQQFSSPVHNLVILSSRTLLKTTSGKMCRAANKSAYEKGQFDDKVLHVSTAAVRRRKQRTNGSGTYQVPLRTPKPTNGSQSFPSSSSSTSTTTSISTSTSTTTSSSSSSSSTARDAKTSLTTDTKSPNHQRRVVTRPPGPLPSLPEVLNVVVNALVEELSLTEELTSFVDSAGRTCWPEFNVDASMDEYGLDSLTAEKLVHGLGEQLGVPLTIYMFLAEPTAAGVASKVLDLLENAQVLEETAKEEKHSELSEDTKDSSASVTATVGTTRQRASNEPLGEMDLPCVLGIGTAVPGENGLEGIGGRHELALPEILERLQMSSKRQEMLTKIFQSSGIETRHMVCKDAEELFFGKQGLGNDEGVDARMAMYKIHAPPLALQAAERAVADWGGDRRSITHVVAVTCTGVLVPGLELTVMQGLGLADNTQRLAITFMGCFGALAGMKAAKAFAAENPANRVVMVCCELSSLHMQLCDKPDQLVATGIFADGSGAMVIGVPNGRLDNQLLQENKETPLFAIHRSSSVVIPNTLDMMSWDLTRSGMTIGLGKAIPHHIYENIRPFAADLLEGAGDGPINFSDCTWALHPGGPLILRAIIEALDIDQKQTTSSWDVLRENGNMSSATLVFVLNDIRNHRQRNSERWVPSLAFGPGLNVEGALLRALF